MGFNIRKLRTSASQQARKSTEHKILTVHCSKVVEEIALYKKQCVKWQNQYHDSHNKVRIKAAQSRAA